MSSSLLRLTVLGALGALGVATACSFLTNLNDLRGSSDAGVPDAAFDVAVDGPFCATHPGHTLCADWDDGVLLNGFTGQTVYGPGGAVEVTTDAAVSLPYSLHGWIGPATTLASSSGRVTYALPSVMSSLRVELDLQICDRASFTQTMVTFFGATCEDTSNLYTEVAFASDSAGDLAELRRTVDGGLVYGDTRLNIALGTGWHHVLLQATYGQKGHVHIEEDHVVALDLDTAVSCVNPIKHQLQIGAYAYGLFPRCDAYVDNVLVDVQ